MNAYPLHPGIGNPSKALGAVLGSHPAVDALLARIERLESRLHELEGSGKSAPTPVVVISAVVSSLIDQKHRIVSVKPLGSRSTQTDSPWALHGRMHLHQARS